MAQDNGVPFCTALWTAMTSIYIRGQALTITKSHEECIGPLLSMARSSRRYGFNDPSIAFSDDPVKVRTIYSYLHIV